MSFEEKFVLVLISGLVSILVSIITTRVTWHAQLKRSISDFRHDIFNLTNDLEVAIINSSPDTIRPTMGRMLENYATLHKDKNLLDGFRSLHSIYCFFESGGYNNNEHRRTEDLQRIGEIRDTLR